MYVVFTMCGVTCVHNIVGGLFSFLLEMDILFAYPIFYFQNVFSYVCGVCTGTEERLEGCNGQVGPGVPHSNSRATGALVCVPMYHTMCVLC